MKLHAYVMHNVGPTMFWNYTAEDLHHAHTFVIEADTLQDAANLIWNLTNVGNSAELLIYYPNLAEHADQVSAYRLRENRSLSVGDAIVFLENERYAGTLAVASMGFDEVGFDLDKLTNVNNDSPVSDAREASKKFKRNPTWKPEGSPS